MEDSKPTKTWKRRWNLAPLSAFAPIIDAFAAGERLSGYIPLSWMYCRPEDVKERYGEPMLRHIEKWQMGERDPDSGLNHLAHAAACAVIILWHEEVQSEEGRPTADEAGEHARGLWESPREAPEPPGDRLRHRELWAPPTAPAEEEADGESLPSEALRLLLGITERWWGI